MDYGNKLKARQATPSLAPKNASKDMKPLVFLTIDLEDYQSIVRRNLGLSPVSAGNEVERGIDALLECVEQVHPGGKLTFFTTGQLAEKRPLLVKRLAEAGHEIACHSHEHRDLSVLSRAELRLDLERATETLERATGRKVLGFRAPSFHVPADRYWLFELLLERGYRYDSSIVSAVPRSVACVFDRISLSGGELLELPVFRYDVLPKIRIRSFGGTYFRALPGSFGERILSYAEANGYPPCLWLHSSDVYRQPTYGAAEAIRVSAGAAAFWPLAMLRDGIGRKGALRKLRQLLSNVRLAGTVGDSVVAYAVNS
ncbi:MAG: polysaccharide deacetylase family protein [Bdellovibrionota bacterium]